MNLYSHNTERKRRLPCSTIQKKRATHSGSKYKRVRTAKNWKPNSCPTPSATAPWIRYS